MEHELSNRTSSTTAVSACTLQCFTWQTDTRITARKGRYKRDFDKEISKTPAFSSWQLVFIDKPALFASSARNTERTSTVTYNELMPKTLGPVSVVEANTHTLPVVENGIKSSLCPPSNPMTWTCYRVIDMIYLPSHLGQSKRIRLEGGSEWVWCRIDHRTWRQGHIMTTKSSMIWIFPRARRILTTREYPSTFIRTY